MSNTPGAKRDGIPPATGDDYEIKLPLAFQMWQALQTLDGTDKTPDVALAVIRRCHTAEQASAKYFDCWEDSVDHGILLQEKLTAAEQRVKELEGELEAVRARAFRVAVAMQKYAGIEGELVALKKTIADAPRARFTFKQANSDGHSWYGLSGEQVAGAMADVSINAEVALIPLPDPAQQEQGGA